MNIHDWVLEHHDHGPQRIEAYDPLYQMVVVAMWCPKRECKSMHLYDWRAVDTPLKRPITDEEIQKWGGFWYGPDEARKKYWGIFRKDEKEKDAN